MQLQLANEDAEVLRDLLRQKITELDKEINRTDSLRYKEQLRQLDRRIERICSDISTALEQGRTGRVPQQ